MKRCPKCGCTEFLVTAHVCQDWKVDENGEFLEIINECSQVTHHPDDNDIWQCFQCDYSGAGDEFNVPEEKPENESPVSNAEKEKALALIRQLRKYRARDEVITNAVMEECGWDYKTTTEFLKKFDADIASA